jgi:hypothetical protein
MKIKLRNRLRNKATHMLYKAILRLENEINANFKTNGEANFLEMFAQDSRGQTKVMFDVSNSRSRARRETI